MPTDTEILEFICDGCDEPYPVADLRQVQLTYLDGATDYAVYCLTCLDLAEANWSGNIHSVVPR